MSFFQSNVKFRQSLGFENCIEYLEPIFQPIKGRGITKLCISRRLHILRVVIGLFDCLPLY